MPFSNLLKALFKHPGKLCLSLKDNDISRYKPNFIARIVVKNDLVHLNNTTMKKSQVEAIFTALDQENNATLKNLCLDSQDLSVLNPEVLAKVFSTMYEVMIYDANLTPSQVNAIFSKISISNVAGESPLKKLEIGSNNLSSVEPDLLGKVAEEMESLDLSRTNLSTKQLKVLLTAASDDLSELMNLDIGSNDISSIHPKLLARAINQLELATISDCSLTTEQAEAICLEFDNVPILSELNIDHNDLSLMNSQLLSRVAHEVKIVDISWCSLKTEQAAALFTEIQTLTQRNIFRMKYLNIQGNNLSELSPELLAKAIVKFNEIELFSTSLTKKQLRAIFKAIDKANNLLLKTMTLDKEDLNKVPQSLAKRVEDKIELLVMGNIMDIPVKRTFRKSDIVL